MADVTHCLQARHFFSTLPLYSARLIYLFFSFCVAIKRNKTCRSPQGFYDENSNRAADFQKTQVFHYFFHVFSQYGDRNACEKLRVMTMLTE